MRLPRPSHATVVAYLALSVAMSGTAAAATGGVFVLGDTNRAGHASVLVNRTGTPLELRAEQGRAPLRVNTERRVRHLNADLLDGKDSGQLLPSLCPEGSSEQFFAAVKAGCTEVLQVSEAMQLAMPEYAATGPIPGADVLCPPGHHAVSGGYRLADDTVRIRSSEPFHLRYTVFAWEIRLFPGASQASVEASTAWAMCVGLHPPV
jgi:hypothetical protein